MMILRSLGTMYRWFLFLVTCTVIFKQCGFAAHSWCDSISRYLVDFKCRAWRSSIIDQKRPICKWLHPPI